MTKFLDLFAILIVALLLPIYDLVRQGHVRADATTDDAAA